jgi:hypothetical protein
MGNTTQGESHKEQYKFSYCHYPCQSDFLSLAATGVDRRESMRVTEAWHLLWPLPVTGYVEVIKKFAFI